MILRSRHLMTMFAGLFFSLSVSPAFADESKSDTDKLIDFIGATADLREHLQSIKGVVSGFSALAQDGSGLTEENVEKEFEKLFDARVPLDDLRREIEISLHEEDGSFNGEAVQDFISNNDKFYDTSATTLSDLQGKIDELSKDSANPVKRKELVDSIATATAALTDFDNYLVPARYKICESAWPLHVMECHLLARHTEGLETYRRKLNEVRSLVVNWSKYADVEVPLDSDTYEALVNQMSTAREKMIEAVGPVGQNLRAWTKESFQAASKEFEKNWGKNRAAINVEVTATEEAFLARGAYPDSADNAEKLGMQIKKALAAVDQTLSFLKESYSSLAQAAIEN